MRKAILCAVIGHHSWPEPVRNLDGDWSDPDPYECIRCGVSNEKAAKAQARWNAVRKWAPLWLRRSRRELYVRVGWDWRRRFSASLCVHWGIARDGEFPGIHAGVNLWRLGIGASVGGFWQDEDGNSRALVRVWSDFETYGIAEKVCRLVGHKPGTPYGSCQWVDCERCGATLSSSEEAAA